LKSNGLKRHTKQHKAANAMQSQNKILLVDADSTIPNIALMKLAAYYKQVDIVKCNISYYPHKRKDVVVNAVGYDKVFVSAIFFSTPNHLKVTNCNCIEYGGSAYSITKKLPDEVIAWKSDYSIYPNADTSYGFLTRGCFRNCEFCIVRQKEGNIHLDESVEKIVQHKQVKFLDNNFLCHPQADEILQRLVAHKIRFQFNQGLDIRLVTDENARLLSQADYIGSYIFAFDNVSDEDIIVNKLGILKKHSTSNWACKFFIYCHPEMDIVNSVCYRVNWCKANQVLPYLMRDISCWDSDESGFYTDLGAWANQPGIFKNMSFEEFMYKRCPSNELRQQRSIATYNEGKQDASKWQRIVDDKSLQLAAEAEQLTTDDFNDLII